MPIPEKIKTLEELANEVRSLAETTAEHSQHWENFEQIVLSYFQKVQLRMPRALKYQQVEKSSSNCTHAYSSERLDRRWRCDKCEKDTTDQRT